MKTDLSTTLSNAMSGLQAGMNKARTAAGEVAKLTTESDAAENTVKPILELQEAERQVAVSGKVARAEDETLGHFVDERV